MEQYCSQGLIAVGACTSAYVLLKLAFKICRLLRIYLWNTSPKLSKYGKWSGKLSIENANFLIESPLPPVYRPSLRPIVALKHNSTFPMFHVLRTKISPHQNQLIKEKAKT